MNNTPIELTIERIKVMQAFVDGAEIQECRRDNDKWNTVSPPHWNWVDYTYRIKPLKKIVPLYATDFPPGSFYIKNLPCCEYYGPVISTVLFDPVIPGNQYNKLVEYYELKGFGNIGAAKAANNTLRNIGPRIPVPDMQGIKGKKSGKDISDSLQKKS